MLLSFTINATDTFPPTWHQFLEEEEECDACGCSSNGGSLGMGGVLDNNFVGVRYLYQNYESKDGIFNNSPTINEHFNTIQIWSLIPIIKDKLEAQVYIPYHFHSREYTDKTTSINGLGDVTLGLNYRLIDSKKDDIDYKEEEISTTNHLVKIGIGVKLPTGKYNEEIENSINPSFQLGTGSVDYLASVQYVFKYNKFGINNFVNYYLKTTNNKEYKFGNQLNFNSTFFYVFSDSTTNKFVPSIGFSGEFYEQNKSYNLPVKDTEGYALFSNVGVEYNTKNITFGALGMFPVSQNLAQGAIDVSYRTSLYVNYNF